MAAEQAMLPLPSLGSGMQSLLSMASGENKPDLDHQGSRPDDPPGDGQTHAVDPYDEGPAAEPDDSDVRTVHVRKRFRVCNVSRTLRRLLCGLCDLSPIHHYAPPATFWHGPQKARVHRGFNAAVHTVLPTIKGIVDMATSGDKSWRIYVTGHSLGAALATIAAYRMATRVE